MRREANGGAEMGQCQATSERLMLDGLVTLIPPVFRRRATPRVQLGSSTEPHSTKTCNVFACWSSSKATSPPCFHASRLHGVEPTGCCRPVHGWLILPFPREQEGRTVQGEAGSTPKHSGDIYSFIYIFRGTCLWTRIKILWLRQTEKAKQQLSDSSWVRCDVLKTGETKRHQIKNNSHVSLRHLSSSALINIFHIG